jgi:regulator of protease activity HflC (stomatin/prohibitin superfamily)
MLEAQGQAEAIRLTAEAQAEALEMIANKLNQAGGEEAARLALARDYVQMYGEMGQKSNTIMFNDRPADVNALLSQAALSMSAAANATKPPALEQGTEVVSESEETKKIES